GQLGKGGGLKVARGDTFGSAKVAVPAVFEYPGGERRAPVSALRGDLARQPEGGRIELEYVNAGYQLLTGIEIFVVKDPRSRTPDPFPVRVQVGLRRAALDLVAQGVLLAVGARNIVIVERK